MSEVHALVSDLLSSEDADRIPESAHTAGLAKITGRTRKSITIGLSNTNLYIKTAEKIAQWLLEKLDNNPNVPDNNCIVLHAAATLASPLTHY